jgi:hypothetical protein
MPVTFRLRIHSLQALEEECCKLIRVLLFQSDLCIYPCSLIKASIVEDERQRLKKERQAALLAKFSAQ